jgi:hypothetical protein
MSALLPRSSIGDVAVFISSSPVPLLIKDTKVQFFIQLLGAIRLPKPKLIVYKKLRIYSWPAMYANDRLLAAGC